MNRFLRWGFFLMTCFFAVEFILRILGFSVAKDIEIPLINCQENLLIRDSLLGYKFQAGDFDCEVNGLSFQTTQLSDHSRSTSDDVNSRFNHELHLYGCSITWGHGLNDEQTMAWKLQDTLDDYLVKNYGIGASSTVQAWLLLQHNISNDRIPDIVIYNYASFHHDRNTLEWTWRKVWQNILNEGYIRGISRNYNIPVVRGEGLTLEYVSENWINLNLPLIKHSVLMNVLNELCQYSRDVEVNSMQITEEIIVEMDRICRLNNIKFVVSGLTSDIVTHQVLLDLKMKGVKVGNIAIDFSLPEYNLMPYDGHPNEMANNIYVQKILYILRACNFL